MSTRLPYTAVHLHLSSHEVGPVLDRPCPDCGAVAGEPCVHLGYVTSSKGRVRRPIQGVHGGRDEHIRQRARAVLGAMALQEAGVLGDVRLVELFDEDYAATIRALAKQHFASADEDSFGRSVELELELPEDGHLGDPPITTWSTP